MKKFYSDDHTDEIKSKMQFRFSSKSLNDLSDIVYTHCAAHRSQINIKALQNIAFLFNYGGAKIPAFYILDVSPSGTGKTSCITHLRDLLLIPVIKKQEERALQDITKYEQSSLKESENNLKLKVPKLYKCIHTNDTSKEALLESFETTRTQMIEMGEIGLKLKKQNPVIEFIIEQYGQKSLYVPNFKNNRFNQKFHIDNTSIFFIGDTSLQYLGRNAFFDHLMGGLINRCMIVFERSLRNFDDLPTEYTIGGSYIQKFNSLAIEMIEFSSKMENYNIKPFGQNPYFLEYARTIYDQQKNLIENRDYISYFYNRFVQNSISIIHTMHYIECFENGVLTDIVSDDTIKEGIAFCKNYIDFEDLIMELTGERDDDRDQLIYEKIISIITEIGLPCKIRDIYRKAHITKSTFDAVMSGKVMLSRNKREINKVY